MNRIPFIDSISRIYAGCLLCWCVAFGGEPVARAGDSWTTTDGGGSGSIANGSGMVRCNGQVVAAEGTSIIGIVTEPCGTGPFGQPNIIINPCSGTIINGSSSVRVNGKPVARVGSQGAIVNTCIPHTAVINVGSPNVRAGD